MGPNRRRLKPADPLKSWVTRFVREALGHHEESDRTSFVAGELDAMALVRGVAELAFRELDGARDPLNSPPIDLEFLVAEDPPGGWANPWLPGLVHEQAVSTLVRRNRGAWYTPPDLVRGLVRLVDHAVDLPSFAVDPTCGGGAFLLALLDHWVDQGVAPTEALSRIGGSDIDPDAVAVCRLAIGLWAASHDVTIDDDMAARLVVIADAVTDDPPARWPDHRLVIGNPPFATPLKSAGGRGLPESADAYRSAHRDELGQYADLAAVHLHRALETVGAGSPVMLVLPQSILSSRDVAGLRAKIEAESATVAMWAAREAVFDAGVRACAPLIVVGGRPTGPPTLAAGPRAEVVHPTSEVAENGAQWATIAARSLGAPAVPSELISPAATLAELCRATAGFRDEYYGLAAAAAEWDGSGPTPNRLVTVGSIDPLATRWGVDPIRLAGRRWKAPYVRVAELDGKVSAWVERQAVPKLVVATQSKLIEPVLDPEGDLVPSTPLLSVHATVDDLAHVAAVLLAPPVVASAWQRWFGSALAVDALKMAAGQLMELPLPPDRRTWDTAAELIATAMADHPGGLSPTQGWLIAVEVAELMNQAYRAGGDVFGWWLARVPKRNAPVSVERHR